MMIRSTALGANFGPADWRVMLAGVALAYLGGAHAAQTTPDAGTGASLAPVTVEALAENREVRSYRNLLKAMEQFEAYRVKYPDAYLRFRIYPRSEGVDLSKLKVSIVGDSRREPVVVSDEASFTLPIIAELREQNADVRANVPSGDLGWRMMIRREGSPDNRRILGDLRQECRLEVDGANVARKFFSPGAYAVNVFIDFCGIRSMQMASYSERPLFSVHMSHGNRHASLLSDLLYEFRGAGAAVAPLLDGHVIRDRRYFAPLYDESWPDDTVMEIEYMDDVGAVAGVQP